MPELHPAAHSTRPSPSRRRTHGRHADPTADLGRIIAFVRSVPPVAGHPREVRLGLLARVGLASGLFETAAADARRATTLSPSYPRAEDPTSRGAYLARTSCTECLGFDLRGSDKHPDLGIAAGYSRDAFVRFMRTGKALGERELPMMSGIARRRFSHFTDDEISALHDYLLARASTRAPTGPKTN
jgi:hypothetical protein